MSKIVIRYQQLLGNVPFDIDLELPESGISAVFGRSGAGKTSLINVVAGLSKPSSGVVSIGERTLFSTSKCIDVPVHKRNVGYVFQDARLFPHFSVEHNLNYGTKKIDKAHFDEIVSLLALDHLLTRYPHQLSGGEKQRVAIGRALLSKPDILLMDEPLASLDLPRKREVLPFLERLSQSVMIPIIYVSHSLNEVLRLANYLVVIDNGTVAAAGSIEDVWGSSVMKPWQSFSEQSSLFEGRVVEHNSDYALSKIELAPSVDLWVQKVEGDINSPVRLQVRSNDVSLMLDEPKRTSIRNVLLGKISTIETHGNSQDRISVAVQVELAPGCKLAATITAWARDELALKVGMEVYVQIKGVSVTQRDVVLSH